MKKTLIALAVAASAAVSGSAMAGLGNFDAGNTTGTVKFAGTITQPTVKNSWLWALGEGYDNFSHTTSDLTESGTKLTVTATDAMPLLVGKVTDAFEGAPDMAPQIQFSDVNGSITPVWDTSSTDGSGTMTLAVRDGQQQDIGAMTLNVNSGAVASWGNTNGIGNISTLALSGASSSTAFHNVIGHITQKSVTNKMFTSFGAPTIDDLLTQLKSKPGMAGMTGGGDENLSSGDTSFSSSSKYYTGAYALGISAGKTFEIKFNKSVTTDTQWEAPLNVLVTYS